MIAVRRCLLLLPVWLTTVTGCAAQVPGEPIPAAGFHDAPAQPRSTLAAQARIPTPRIIAGMDPCTLLTPADLASVGGAVGPPHRDSPISGSCAQRLGSGAENTAAAGFYESYEIAASRQPRGAPVDVDGHSAWLYCEVVSGYQTCTATTAVRQDRSLLTMLSVQGASAADTSDQLFQLTRAALGKLPRV